MPWKVHWRTDRWYLRVQINSWERNAPPGENVSSLTAIAEWKYFLVVSCRCELLEGFPFWAERNHALGSTCQFAAEVHSCCVDSKCSQERFGESGAGVSHGSTSCQWSWPSHTAVQGGFENWLDLPGATDLAAWLGLDFVVQLLVYVRLFVTPWTAAPQASLFFSLPGFSQTYVHWVDDAIWSSHPLSSRSPPAINFSQHQGHFQWAGSSYQVAKVLELQLQHQSFQWIFRVDFL